jgi:hypothetical protein
MADPPIYTQADLEGPNAWVTIVHVMNANEALDLKYASEEANSADSS